VAKLKSFESYLVETTAHKTSASAYAKCPADAFLLYVCDAYDSFVHCLNKFTKKTDGNYNTDSQDSLRHISCAILGTLMGHFETYQKSLFAGVVERTNSFPSFDIERFLKHFDKHCGGEISISTDRLLAFRELSAPVGFVIADSLSSWHSAVRVNSYFKAFDVKQDLFSNTEVSDLEVLWQLRHSIVHTGAWLTVPDAKKVRRLSKLGDKPIVFDSMFINAVCRRFHRIVKNANQRLLADCTLLLGPSPLSGVIPDFQAFLAVKSPYVTWL